MSEHPFWAWSLKIVSILSLLTLILFLSANNFDETEANTIFWFGAALGLSSGGKEIAGAVVKKYIATKLWQQPKDGER